MLSSKIETACFAAAAFIVFGIIPGLASPVIKNTMPSSILAAEEKPTTPCEEAIKPLDARFLTIFNLTEGYREAVIKNKSAGTRTVFCRENPKYANEIRSILSDFEKLKAGDSGQCAASETWKKFQSDMEGTLKGSLKVQEIVCGK